ASRRRRPSAGGRTPAPGSIGKSALRRRRLPAARRRAVKKKKKTEPIRPHISHWRRRFLIPFPQGARAMTEETIFTAAREKQSPTERSAFLDEACGGDAALRQRVEALIEAHEQAADFLEKPAAEQIAAGISPSTNHTERIDAVKPAVEGITETPADPLAAETG